jgi:predicted RNA-binding Zn-ribbon protein involved in translation (DUF1610 family)
VTRIRASCPSCGEVDLQPMDVTLRVIRRDDGNVGPGSNYRFACPDCEQLVTKPADDRIAQLLTTGGVPVEDRPEGSAHEAPDAADRPHPESPPTGPPLTHDDLLDLHLLLEREDWFEQLASLIS